jgi:hypothetical protein
VAVAHRRGGGNRPKRWHSIDIETRTVAGGDPMSALHVGGEAGR